ncbi:MAG TPA: hypothetical protein VL633_05710 [Bacteroidota bacterium]|jgi:hypothetical protein|nr:hypothetical protein [Bacteroidota bacterium]
MKKNYFIYAVLLFIRSLVVAQTDSVGIDTTGSGSINEILLEQSTDNSPALEDEAPGTHQALAFRSRISQRLQRSRGYADGGFTGSPLASYQRLTYSPGVYSFGILMTKDPGEQKMNDLTVWSFGIHDIGMLKNALAGSYRIEAGQGIALSRGYGFSKGADVVTPASKKSRGLISSLSSDEASSFKGAALELSGGLLSLILFYSRKYQSTSLNSAGDATSIITSGYYRTQMELSRRDNLIEILPGMHAQFSAPFLTIGMTWYRSTFSSRLLLDDGRKFSGDRYAAAAIDYRATLGSLSLFGEWARVNSEIGGISGVRLSPGSHVILIASVRSYPYRFFSMHGSGFQEGSSMSNELGVYLAMAVKLARSINVSLYVDQFTFPEKTSASRFPTGGSDALVQCEWSPVRQGRAIVRYQRKLTSDRSASFPHVGDVQRLQRFRMQFDYQISEHARLRSRVDNVLLDWRIDTRTEQGLGYFQDFRYQWGKKFSWNLRVSMFRTDSYSTRISTAEDDVEGAVSLPVLYGTGVRWYSMVEYQAGENVRLSAKYSDTLRDDVKHMGSGMDELPANHDDRVSLQADFRL